MEEVVSFYAYCAVDPEPHAVWQREFGAKLGLLGRVVVAAEGISGTLSGRPAAIDEYAKAVAARLRPLDLRRAPLGVRAFPDLYVKTSREIVGTGLPAGEPGEHLEPREFKRRLVDDAIVLDVRNGFEYDVGHFRGAVRAPIRTMAEWARWVDREGIVEKCRNRDALLYCTGGVRCEKASAFLKARGVRSVAQLEGGIHRFLDELGDDDLWHGRNFCFDAREVAPAPSRVVVGRCADCGAPWETHSGRNVCTVCETLVLVCPACARENHEHYCDVHAYLRSAYCHFLDRYSDAELQVQADNLHAILRDSDRARESPNVRRALRRQIDRISARARKDTPAYDGPPRCRSCGQASCVGACWGFWKAAAAPL
ncbi:hypothetical protein CTAYLR_005037 [Chrysophaeum taylorii]|uniref:Rhodanese domain-containing protein n=1 Tax=Chrysophaeum taylorii TaxID=2483200 RepID=A0AAD7XJ74_9STRA|nr:hypothetical protein CTAYLR_005037 [Chrysophaeum taylorii]